MDVEIVEGLGFFWWKETLCPKGNVIISYTISQWYSLTPVARGKNVSVVEEWGGREEYKEHFTALWHCCSHWEVTLDGCTVSVHSFLSCSHKVLAQGLWMQLYSATTEFSTNTVICIAL